MLTVRLGSVALQDPSWGGPEGRVRSVRCRGVRDGHSAQRDEVSVLSLRLFGLVEITQTKTSQRSA